MTIFELYKPCINKLARKDTRFTKDACTQIVTIKLSL